MKTLKNHIILYDSECPMCSVYSRAFTTSGMLDSNGRAPYQEMPAIVCPVVDRQRAVNEIALVDTTTGEVSYGIHSLFKVISHSFPVFGPLFRWQPFVWLMTKLYAFISYNRKVIIPPPMPVNTSTPANTPSFSLRYRLLYLAFTLFVSGFILTRYARLLTGLITPGNAYREYFICAGQIAFQGLAVALLTRSRRSTISSLPWDYLGNMMTISLAGSLLLLPALAAHSILSPTLAALYFLFVAGCMLLEHIRRTKLLGLPWVLSASWVTYRMVLLLLILL